MIEILFPKKYLQSIFDLRQPALIDELKNSGIKLLLFDIDNTLAPYYEKRADKKIVELLNYLKESGFRIGLLSNGKQERVKEFNRDFNVLAFHKSGKPGTKKLRKAIRKLKRKENETAIIGDQIFTDVLCANLAGAYSILVKQMSAKDEWITKIKRGVEKKVVAYYEKSVKNDY